MNKNTVTKTYLSELKSEFHSVFVLPTPENVAYYNLNKNNFVGWLLVKTDDLFEVFKIRRSHMNKDLRLTVYPDGQEFSYDNNELFIYENEPLEGEELSQNLVLAKEEKFRQRQRLDI